MSKLDMEKYVQFEKKNEMCGMHSPINIIFDDQTGEVKSVQFYPEGVKEVEENHLYVRLIGLIIRCCSEYCKNGQNKPLFFGVEENLMIRRIGKEQAEDYGNLFAGYNGERLNLSRFYVKEEAVSMNSMFKRCRNLKELVLEHFDTSNVTDMSHMFCGCVSLEKLDLSSFDISKLEEMDCMFNKCKHLVEIKTPEKSASIVPELPNGEWVDTNGKIYTTLPTNATESIVLKKKLEL